MLKVIFQVGDSLGVVLDAELMDRAGLMAGDKVTVTVAGDGAIVIRPICRASPHRPFLSARTLSPQRRATG